MTDPKLGLVSIIGWFPYIICINSLKIPVSEIMLLLLSSSLMNSEFRVFIQLELVAILTINLAASPSFYREDPKLEPKIDRFRRQ